MKAFLVALPLISLLVSAGAAPPVISDIRVGQRPGTGLVDIVYDLSDADGGSLSVLVAASSDGGLLYNLPCVTLTGAVGGNVPQGTDRRIVWDAAADWGGNWVEKCRIRLTAHDGSAPPAPAGMVYIPEGPFQMGDDSLLEGGDTRPIHNVTISSMFMDKCEVTRELWESVRAWGNAHHYQISSGGWKAERHPVLDVTWFNALAWCNARSEMEGLTPCYYLDSDKTTILLSGENFPILGNDTVKWEANGYRLPTEAEWEKAARGGRTGQRFPWGKDPIPTAGNFSDPNSPWNAGGDPKTSTVGFYPANDYGIYDVMGNVCEWCWDWASFDYYGNSLNATDPRGPESGAHRVRRGGGWQDTMSYFSTPRRGSESPSRILGDTGLRTIRRAPSP